MRARVLAAVVGMVLLAGCGAGVIPPIHSESERFTVAQRLFAQGDYTESIELLKTYVSNNAGSASVDEALYMLGEAYLKTKEYPTAQVEFERLLRDYPESDSSGSAAFRLGDALFGQSRGPDFDQEFTHKALDQWESYRRSYPDHWRIAEADKRIGETRRRLAAKMLHNGQLYLKLKLGDPARMYFQRVLDDYPETPQAGEARLGLAMADAIAGRKPQAIASLKELESQFPGQPIAVRAAKERARLEK